SVHEPDAHRADRDRAREHQVEVRILEQEHAADRVRLAEGSPAKQEAEERPEADRDRLDTHQDPPSPRITNERPTAVAKNVPVATKLEGEPNEQPVSPLPDVQ